MKNSDAGTRIIAAINALTAVLLIVAISAFALAGSQSVAEIPCPAIGGSMGSVLAFLLTRSLISGRFVVGLLSLTCVVASFGTAVIIVSRPEVVAEFLARRMPTTTFASAFSVGLFVTALFRLLGSGAASRPRGG